MEHDTTLRQFLTAMRSAHHLSDMTVTGMRWKLANLLRAWDDKPLDQVGYGDWEDYLAHNDQWTPATIKMLTVHSRRFIRWCRARGIPCNDWLEGYKPPRAVPVTVKVAKPEHVRTMLEAAKEKSPRLRVAIALAAYAGLRRNEIITIRWSDVDLEARRLHVLAPKTKRERWIPLNRVLFSILEEWRPEGAEPSDPVLRYPCFGGTNGNGNRDLRKLQDWCGVPSHGWHAMRHHFGTELIRAGVDIGTVRDLMGHSSLTMTSRYIHSSPKSQRDAVETLVA